MKIFSVMRDRNIPPLLEKWGIPISDEVKNDLRKYAAWMPYNFPRVKLEFRGMES